MPFCLDCHSRTLDKSPFKQTTFFIRIGAFDITDDQVRASKMHFKIRNQQQALQKNTFIYTSQLQSLYFTTNDQQLF